MLEAMGNYNDALLFSERALEGRKAIHADTTTSLNNLSMLLTAMGKHQEAEPLSRQVLESRQNTLGPNHPDTFTSFDNLAVVLRAQGKYKEAMPLCRRALEGREATLG